MADSLHPDFCLRSYGFHLPEELIAQAPAGRRDASRLLVLERGTGRIREGLFPDLLQYLPEKCLLVANNSRVIPARVEGRRPSGGRVEFLLLTPPPLLRITEEGDSPLWPDGKRETLVGARVAAEDTGTTAGTGWQSAPAEGLLRSSKKVRPGETLAFAPDFSVTVEERGAFGRCRVTLRWRGRLPEVLARCGSLPLPPYIRRPADEADSLRYQTSYSREDKAGSVAAPTAGLHFTPELREALLASGREWAEATLYVGYGTFSPVRTDDIRDHAMHAEYVELPEETARLVNRARAEGRAVVAVGTTSARVLEGVFAAQYGEKAAEEGGERSDGASASLRVFSGWINIFLYPGKRFQVVDGLITNFHLPESSLLMLVSALAGRETILHAYAWAVEQRYRFFSYGDAMLIL